MSGQASITSLGAALQIPGYRLTQVVGRGTFGEVWLAEELLTGLRRAVKVLQKTAVAGASDPLRELAGIREYQQKSKDHPCLLQIYHVGETPECYYYAMELADRVELGNGDQGPIQGIEGSRNRAIEGAVNAGAGRIGDPARHCSENAAYVPQTLAAVIAREAPMPAGRALDITTQVLRGLEHLHAQGLIHRDVKPSNVLVIDGQIKLGDLGLVTSSDRDVTQIGTPGYMPNDAKLDHTADLYATGIMLYEMITGLHRSKFPELPVLRPKTRRERCELRVAIRVANQAAHPDRKQRFGTSYEFVRVIEYPRLHRVRQMPGAKRRIFGLLMISALCVWLGYRQVSIDDALPFGERTVQAKGEWGRTWTRGDFGARINKPLCADLDGDEVAEVIVPTVGQHHSGSPTDSGKLYALRARRAWPRLTQFWAQPVSLYTTVNPWGQPAPAYADVTVWQHANLDGKPGDELIVAVNYDGALSRVAVVVGNPPIIHDFWHWGSVDVYGVIDIDGDGTQELICGGDCNYPDPPKTQEPFTQAFMVLNVDSDGRIRGNWRAGRLEKDKVGSLRAYGRIRPGLQLSDGKWELAKPPVLIRGSKKLEFHMSNFTTLVLDDNLNTRDAGLSFDSAYEGDRNLTANDIYERLWPQDAVVKDWQGNRE
jgi:serine/threonine protein kinase